jgi:hypothetical protein
MGLALSLTILSVLPGVTKAQEMALVQDTPTANQNPDATTVQSEPSDKLIVYPGDSLWSISQERLGPSASPKQIADEVGRTFELNRDRIGDDPNLILVGQELLRPPPAAPVKTATNEPTPASEPVPANEPVSVEIVASDPEPTSEPAAAEPPLEASAEARAEPYVVLPEVPEADAELVSASVQVPSATPERDGDARRKAGYAVLLFTFAVALLGTAMLLSKRHRAYR